MGRSLQCVRVRRSVCNTNCLSHTPSSDVRRTVVETVQRQHIINIVESFAGFRIESSDDGRRKYGGIESIQ